VTVRGLPSVSAWATFFLALWRSLQIVPLETPIFVPACSCDRSSRSTSRRASTSAGSIWIGLLVVVGCGMNFSTFGGFGMVTGLGNRPLLPRRHRLCGIVINYVWFSAYMPNLCSVTLIYFCAYSNKCKLCINTKIEVK